MRWLGLVLVSIIGLLTVLVVEGQQPQRQIQTSAQATSRYQIIINPNVRADTMLLDTETGKVWTPLLYSEFDGSPTVWTIQDRVDNADQLAAWIASHQQKPILPPPRN